MAQLRQLQTGVAGLIASIDGAQLQPEPRLQQLSQALAARFSLAMQQALGLMPWPKRTPLNPVIHSRRTYDGYSVENVMFESIPGYFVTGNLYRPLAARPPYAAVLSPHLIE